MIPARALPPSNDSVFRGALAVLACLGGLALPAHAGAAGPLDLNAGLRAAIYDENYKLGYGLELGLVQNLSPVFDLGLHLNYTRFNEKTPEWGDTDELGGYATAYYIPTLADQPFEARLGPHVGGTRVDESWHLDLGGDAMVLFKVADMTKFYAAFIPSYLVGKESQGLIRIGFGIEYRLSGGASPAVGEP
jgi:hypothetical protein